MRIRNIRKPDFKKVHNFQCRYNDEESFEDFLKRAKSKENIYIGAFNGDNVIGIAYGNPSPFFRTAFELQGISVELDPKKGHARTGIGSKLLVEYEKRVKRKGWNRVSLGSADDPKVESFYLKNGYKAIEVKAKGKDHYLYEKVKVKNFEEGLKAREKLRKKYKPKEVIFIFEKRFK